MRQKSHTVLLIPGIFDRGNALLRMQRALAETGFDAHYIHLRYNSGWHGMEHLSAQLMAKMEKILNEEETCTLVGFSMGGIVARYYLQAMSGISRVHKFISIASPHHGSYWANFLPYKGGQQLRIGSDFLNSLNSSMHLLEETDPVSIWTKYDITIMPHSSAQLGVGISYEVPVILHRLMPMSSKVISLMKNEVITGMK
ncbi:alpha/beta fold hydrolase [Microbulbifer sp. THAF38]|uniref:lipase family alpha/beta hydrolase n=1 Tax=unclassified Microbulbifer TaxID=2619833 RepID=UPI00126811E9|nr:alpha/beta fold hydrolase [Microbulbifer sp. THAF38]QFT56728.1 PGAP1-like protein [Microbulbifer sp. THAF38]